MAFLLIILILLCGTAYAGDYTVSSTGTNAEQNTINDAVEKAATSGGGTVTLSPGVYLTTGPVYLASNVNIAGTHDSVIKVSPESLKWFVGAIGIISTHGTINNVALDGFSVDGSCDVLPASYANSAPQYQHDAGRGVYITCQTSDFGNNIVIQGLQVYNCFSDGIQVRFANNVLVQDCFVSNCQHESVFFTCVVNGVIKSCRMAGITSDNIRLDNNVKVKVHGNTLFSYTGVKNNGAYQMGQSGLQIGDAGASHGYDASKKPLSTQDIEVYDNIFANIGLKNVQLGSEGKDPTNNVWIHDNVYLTKEDMETSGVSFDTNVSYTNMPTKEMSENIFSSIFDILKVKTTSSGITKQTDEQIQYTVQNTEHGDVVGGIKIVGFKNKVTIDNQTYIPDDNSTIVKYSAAMSPSLNFFGMATDKIDNKVSVSIKDGIATARLDVTIQWYTVSMSKNSLKLKKTYHTSTASFNDTSSAPTVIPKDNVTAFVNVYPSEVYPTSRVNIHRTNFTQRIEYRYEDTVAIHTFLIGEVKTDNNGIEHTIYNRVDRWDGNKSHMANEFIADGPFNPTHLSITYCTPYSEEPVTDVRVSRHGVEKDTWEVPQLGFIFRLLLMLIILAFLWRIVFL